MSTRYMGILLYLDLHYFEMLLHFTFTPTFTFSFTLSSMGNLLSIFRRGEEHITMLSYCTLGDIFYSQDKPDNSINVNLFARGGFKNWFLLCSTTTSTSTSTPTTITQMFLFNPLMLCLTATRLVSPHLTSPLHLYLRLENCIYVCSLVCLLLLLFQLLVLLFSSLRTINRAPNKLYPLSTYIL